MFGDMFGNPLRLCQAKLFPEFGGCFLCEDGEECINDRKVPNRQQKSAVATTGQYSCQSSVAEEVPT